MDIYEFQIVPADITERPEYDTKDNLWDTIFTASSMEELGLLIADWLNDENYPHNEWVRIIKNGKSLHR